MTDDELRSAMREMGRRGGLVGGNKRRDAMTPAARAAAASKAARKRWNPPYPPTHCDGSEIAPLKK